jgi:hypothetical protein
VSKIAEHCLLCRIFSDVAEDVTVSVDGQSFLLHKVSLSLFL